MKDLLKISIEEQKVKILSGEQTAFRSKNIQRMGMRKFLKEGLITSAAAVGEISLAQLEKNCDQSAVLGVVAEAMPVSTTQRKWDAGENLQMSLLQEVAQKSIDRVARALPKFIFQGNVLQQKIQVEYTNDLGATLSTSYNTSSLVLDLRRRGSPNISDGFLFYNNHGGFQHEELLDFHLPMFETFDENVVLPSGRYKVLSYPDPALIRKVGESLKANSYYEGTGFYSGKLGSQIFSPKISFADIKLDPKRGGISPFDFEGTVASEKSLPLIHEGKMLQLISDLKHQKRFGVPSTGNGFRRYNSSVELDFSALSLQPGHRSAMEILKDAGEVIVTSMAFGGDITEEGSFSTPIQLGYLFRDGKPVGRLNSLALNTHIQKIFCDDLLEVSSTYLHSAALEPFMLFEADIQAI